MNFTEILNRVSDILTGAQVAVDVLDDVSENIGYAIVIAEADPTSQHLQDVVTAYVTEGKIPPAGLISHLISRNESMYPEDKYTNRVISNVWPWIVGGAIVLYFLWSKRK